MGRARVDLELSNWLIQKLSYDILNRLPLSTIVPFMNALQANHAMKVEPRDAIAK